ncbi:MAG: folylpolyglutamate synthase [Phylliscum demangeonii]|nr:MAG: folylpolyglutamate synthase [Phylliscum demangeonii]
MMPPGIPSPAPIGHILPGLSRTLRLGAGRPQRWAAVHVAGTNGKGSICAYLSAMLHAAGLRAGRFTSPHLLERRDSISVDERVVDRAAFASAEAAVRRRDAAGGIGASEFELLTAVAFELFTRAGVDVAVIEAGMGGRFDATNVLRAPTVSVIAKIGLDHQRFLGQRLQSITWHKAGIIKRGVPWVVDCSNEPRVLEELRKHAAIVDARPCLLAGYPDPATTTTTTTAIDGDVDGNDDTIWQVLPRNQFEPHQQTNLACAVAALKIVLAQWPTYAPSRDLAQPPPSLATILPAVLTVEWPGRLQRLSIERLTGRRGDTILLDGAHNVQSAEVLASYVYRHLRRPSTASAATGAGGPMNTRPVTWLLASSTNRHLRRMYERLIRPEDGVVAVEFSPVDGMPWVQPVRPEFLLAKLPPPPPLASQGAGAAVRRPFRGPLRPPPREVSHGANVREGLLRAARLARDNDTPLVVAGSLYLVADVLRLLRDGGQEVVDDNEDGEDGEDMEEDDDDEEEDV